MRLGSNVDSLQVLSGEICPFFRAICFSCGHIIFSMAERLIAESIFLFFSGFHKPTFYSPLVLLLTRSNHALLRVKRSGIEFIGGVISKNLSH